MSCPNSNPVVNENNCTGAGSTAYQTTNYSDNLGGFPTQTSYNIGQSVDLKIGVSAPKAGGDTLNIQVFRIGYYGGDGARLISSATVQSNNTLQCNPADPTTGELSCSNWNISYTVPGSSLTTSGIYEAKITDSSQGGIQNYVVFPVRNDARSSRMLFVLPDATYQAYNTFGCKSLYFDNCGGPNTVSGNGRAVAVSFDRPLVSGDANRNDFLNGPDLSQVQWLEQQGYDVTYTDDIQTDQDPAALLSHKVIVISGHSEYWSSASFNNFMAARDAGVSIASFSGNTAYWQTRYADNHRTLICYKTIQGPNTPNDPASEPNGPGGPYQPQLATTTRRDAGVPAGTTGAPPEGRIGPNQPENRLWGTMYVGDNEDKQFPLTIPAGDSNGQFAANRLWRGSGISPNVKTTISTGQGNDIVGWEWDGVPNASSPAYAAYAAVEPAGVKQLTLTDVTDPGDSFIQDAGNQRASTPPPGQPSTVSSAEYRAPSGAVVFSAGVNNWALGLGDPRLAQATYNVFADMDVQPDTPDGITASSGPAPPWAGFNMMPNPVHYGNSVSFDGSGSAADSGASIVDYQYDFGDGHFVDNGASPTASHTYPTEGTFTTRLKVTDGGGQTDITSRTLTVGGDPPPTASLKVTPAKPVAGQPVTLDASGSTGPVNPIVDYRWDLDGSGLYATDTGASPTTSTSFTTTGTYTIGLKVTDSKGATNTTTTQITVLATGASSYPDAVKATPGLLDYFRLGESAGPPIADSFGSAQGTIAGGTFGAGGAVQGDPNTAISFNGSSDSGTIPLNLSASKAITVEFWLKWNAYANDDALAMEFTSNFNDNSGGFLVDPNSSFGQFAVAIGRGASRNIAMFPRPSAGTWHHYAFVLDTAQPAASEITPYVDGQAVPFTSGGFVGTGAGNFANANLYLMSRGGSSLLGAGSLDELAIYNGGLDLKRIQDHYNSFGTNPRPLASLQVVPNPVKPGQTVTFDASGSHYANGSITKYEWDLNGDGTYEKTTSTPTVTATYNTTQTVNIGLRVTDGDFGTDYTTQSLLVGNAPPNPSLKVDHNPAIAGQPVKLDASGSVVPNGQVTDYKWDLDGSGQFATDTGTNGVLTRTFPLPGTYTIGLIVTSDAGLTATTTLKLQVLDRGVGDYTDTVLRTPGILHYYGLGENAGPSVADSVGSAPGTISGGTFGAGGAVQGDPNTAISFNGASDSGAIALNLSGSSAITVEFWLKWNAYANDDALAMEFTDNFNDSNGGFLVDPNSSFGQFAVAIGNGPSRNVALFPRPSAGVWHHYSLVLDTTQPGATAITPYVDAQAVSYTSAGFTGTGAGNFANSTLHLMSRGGSSLFGAGTLDDVAIYNGDLTGNQIADHFAAHGTNTPPTAGFTSAPQVGVGQPITFDASSSNDPNGQVVDYQWDLDGSGNYATDTGSDPHLTTSFAAGGTKTIGLRVIDNGYASDATAHTIVVGDTPPVALFSAPSLALTGQTVTFDASGSTDQYGTIVDYKWDLDGSGQYATDTGTNPGVAHTYSTPGTYAVGLRVTNDQGQTTTYTQTLGIRTASYPNAVLTTPGLVSYWRLGDAPGSTTLADSAGANPATNSGATLGVPGAVYQDADTAARFNGSSSSASVPLNLSGASAVTVEFWLKWNAYANDDALAMEFTNNFNDNSGGFLVDPNSSFGQFAVAIGNGASRNLALFQRPSAGVWHHYAFVLDTTAPGATEITPYVDGQAVSYTNNGSAGTGAGNFANSTLYLMSRAGSSLFGAGDLDELAIYNEALSGATVADHYVDGAGPPPPSLTVTAPASAAGGTAIPATAISTALFGTAAGAGGGITFKVFGPQATAPTVCSTGGTTVGGQVAVSGYGSYHATASFTPTAAGTYWWYAGYGGDASNGASDSGCGAAMVSTTVTTATGITITAPASGTAGTAIAPSSVTAALSGAAPTAGGTVTFKVFGPQGAAPSTCTTGGATIGTPVNVAGSGSYQPSGSFTPSGAGTYWWHASYSGDTGNAPSASACGAAMASTTVAATPTMSVSVPATATAGTAMSASSVTSTLSGAASGAGGTITFKVFGPQATAPTACTTSGTTVGTAVTVSGGGAYHPSAAFTASAAGTYWWYAGYSGDANDAAADSGCGSAMGSTTVTAATSLSVAAPAMVADGTAIAASSISSTLSGVTGGAGGTISFTVFGPQATAPTACSTGGTAVGPTVSVAGGGDYNPSAAFRPNAAGTYWWYASYSGDASNAASDSGCGSAMTSTAVAKAVTTTGASAPASGAAGTAIAASSISSTLSGAASGAGGTITFKVFGPQTTAPTTCTSGGTTIGTDVSVTAAGTYHPSVAFTPVAAGTYWWYASYSGDASNAASASSCASGMASTTVAKANTTTSAAGPASGAAGTAIAASSISSTLSGAVSGAGGTITFKVFGPQTTAPTTCTSGGTTIGGAVTASGAQTYHPSAAFTPGAAGTYWWYAGYGGDASDNASNSACGTGMSSTTVAKATTATTAAAPATGTAGTAMAASTIGSTLSGATSTAGGTITFRVFGPQTTAPTTCTSGGTAVGGAVTVSGNKSYSPTAAFTPGTAGTYWWYASYAGDANNAAASSGCGASMTKTYVYGASSVANATDSSVLGTSTTTSPFTVSPNTTYLLLVYRHSSASDAITSISSSGLAPALNTASFTSIASQSYNTSNFQWAYRVTTGNASGTGSLTVNFAKGMPVSAVTIVELVRVQGNNLTTPVVTANVGKATGTATTATANLPSAPSASDAELVFLSAQQGLGATDPVGSPAMANVFYSQQSAGTMNVDAAIPARQSESYSVGAGRNWGTIAVEINHG